MLQCTDVKILRAGSRPLPRRRADSPCGWRRRLTASQARRLALGERRAREHVHAPHAHEKQDRHEDVGAVDGRDEERAA